MRRIFAAIFTVISLANASAAAPVEPFTGFVGFGDSFSDKGRFNVLQPPSNGGRFTDGLSWMETLGQEFTNRAQGNFNMALGGATAGPINTNDLGYAIVDLFTPRNPANPDDIPLLSLRNLTAQVSSFAAAGFDKLVGGNPLTAIFIGGNDIVQNPLVNPFDVIANIRAGIRQIAALGSAFDSFMVATLPDFSLQPSLAHAPDSERGPIRLQTIGFNALLVADLIDLSLSDGLEIEFLDLFTVTDSAYAEAKTAGLILDDVCTPSLTAIEFNPANNCLLPGSSKNFLFLDNLHPGDFAHSRWADAAVAQISDRLAPIPLPAGLPLMLIGIAGFCILGKRRAA